MILNQFLQSLVIQCWKFWNNGEKLFYDALNEHLLTIHPMIQQL